MLENVSGLNHNKALKQCYLNGSKISMKYDNDWLKVSEVDFHYLWINVLLIEHNGGMLIHNLPQVPRYLINRSSYICVYCREHNKTNLIRKNQISYEDVVVVKVLNPWTDLV